MHNVDRPGQSPASATVTGNATAQGTLELAITGRTARITISNPGKRNAMNADMWRQVPQLLATITADTGADIRAVVLTGAGDAFCSGADISELHLIEGGGESITTAAEKALLDCPLPTIALINGLCIGGGCQLAAACDIRISGPQATFGITPAKLGIVYPASSIVRLTELVGPATAKILLFSADFFSAEQARQMRLVDEVTEDAAGRVQALTETITGRSQLTVRASKELVDLAARGQSLEQRAQHWEQIAAETGETREGIAAFLQRRPPRFPYR